MADGFEIVSIASWNEFKMNFIENLRTAQTSAWPDLKREWQRRRFIFRGQSCGRWPLISSFDRWMEKQPRSKRDPSKISEKYIELLSHFIINGRELDLLPDEFSGVPHEKDALMRYEAESKESRKALLRLQAFAQHRGLATRLLDWSYSPYVAAFFAFSDWRRCRSATVSIWCLDTEETDRLFADQDIRILRPTGSDDRRQVWQRGTFTQNNSNLYQLEDLFRGTNQRTRAEVRFPTLLRLDLPVGAAKDALNDLELMRINYLTVYPDLEGLRRHSEFLLAARYDLPKER